MISNSIYDLYSLFKSSKGVSTDTRTIKNGQIFFALKGENFNGNKYAEKALKAGALKAVIDEAEYETDQTILVDDALEALQQLATFHRKQLDIPVIGLTGSNGKTTTKELIQAVLSKKFKAFATHGNLNNHIGVPLSVLEIDKSHEIAVIEMGANHIGEIALLCEIAQPDHGMITNVGKDHLEGFGSFEGSLRANSELYQYLIQNEGTAFINSEDPILLNMSKRFRKKPVFYPGEGDYYHCKLLSADPFITIQGESVQINTKMIGSYNFSNIASALCIGKYFGIEEKIVVEAVESYSPSNNRSQLVKKGDITIILDAYNANPSSVEVAIESFTNMNGENKVIILGDMFELGDYSDEEHERIARIAAEGGDMVILCGEDFHKAAVKVNSEKILSFRTRDDLNSFLNNKQWGKSTFLIKGSRGMKMEEVVEYLH